MGTYLLNVWVHVQFPQDADSLLCLLQLLNLVRHNQWHLWDLLNAVA